jgi:hypothetical protein
VEAFTKACNRGLALPVSADFLHDYTKWALNTAKLRVGTVASYISSLRLLHILSKVDSSQFDDEFLKKLLQGGKNREIYRPMANNRASISLPLLKVLGHQISRLAWGEWAKQTVWTACTVAFFGAFRMGELLPAREEGNNNSDTLLWRDIKLSRDHALVHIKCPKSKTAGGEQVDLFEFPGHGVCPIRALEKLREISAGISDKPVFSFQSGTCLTSRTFNSILRDLLQPILGDNTRLVSGHSFRSAIPTILGKYPTLTNISDIKSWGRWQSGAYQRYMKLKKDQKRDIFQKIRSCIEKDSA